MGPNAIIDCDSDLGSRDMDRNHDWINDGRQRYSNTDLADVDTFVNQASGSEQLNGEEEEKEDPNLNYETLNEEQKRVFKRIERHYDDILADQQVDPLRIIVMGTAGTGKSYFIKAI